MNRSKTKLEYFRIGLGSKPRWNKILTIFGLTWAITRKEFREMDNTDKSRVNDFMKVRLQGMKFQGCFGGVLLEIGTGGEFEKKYIG